MRKLLFSVSILLLFSFSVPYFTVTTWNNLLSDRAITFENMKNAIDSGYFGQKLAFTSTTELMTKNDVSTYVVVDSSFSRFSAKSSGQIIVKADLQSTAALALSNYVMWASSTPSSYTPYASSAIACALTPGNPGQSGFNVSTPGGVMPYVGVRLEFSPGVYLGTGWWLITFNDPPTYSTPSPKRVFHIDASGYVDQIVFC